MPHIIKNDTDSYIMKNGITYGDGYPSSDIRVELRGIE